MSDRLCDKCVRLVDPKNDVSALAVEAFGLDGREANLNELAYLKHRHLLPVHNRYGKLVCSGSPSRAQYIEGQPRDTRGYGYNLEREAKYREAYARIQARPGDGESWLQWTSKCIADIYISYLDDAARILSNSWRLTMLDGTLSSKWTAEDETGHNVMFSHPLVLANAQDLWDRMRPNITRGRVRLCYKEVKEAGWKIRLRRP